MQPVSIPLPPPFPLSRFSASSLRLPITFRHHGVLLTNTDS